jgi:hypothetical protein
MTSTDLARQLMTDPRFLNDTGEFFDETAAEFGLDFTGLAWMQAILGLAQGAGR